MIPSVSAASVIAVAISICSSSICTRDALSGRTTTPLLAQHQRADHCLHLPCYPRRLMRRRSATPTCIKFNPAAPCACGRISLRVGGRDGSGRLHDRLRRCCRRRQCHWCPHFRRRNAAATAAIASVCIWCRSWRYYLVGSRRLQGRWRLADRRRSRLRAAHVGHLLRCTTDQRNVMDGRRRKHAHGYASRLASATRSCLIKGVCGPERRSGWRPTPASPPRSASIESPMRDGSGLVSRPTTVWPTLCGLRPFALCSGGGVKHVA